MLIRLGSVFFLLSVIFWLWAIFDSITADRSRIRTLPKWAWIALVLLFLEVGALAWVLFGRPRTPSRSGGGLGSGRPSGGLGSGRSGGRSSGSGRTGSDWTGIWGGARPEGGAGSTRPASPGSTAARRPIGPDDDPDFLQGLSPK